MKLLNKLTISALALPIAIVPVIAITSCNENNDTVSIIGASYDKSLSHIAINEQSTIYLIPAEGKKITGIKKISVGETTLTNLQYSLEFDVNSKTKLTINANSMKSINISIEVQTNAITEILAVNYSGSYKTNAAVLKPYTYEIEAKYADNTKANLAVGEYKIYLDGNDITTTVTVDQGYRMDQVKTYNFKFVSTVDTSLTFDKSLEITAPSTTKIAKVSYDAASVQGWKFQNKTTSINDSEGWRLLSFSVQAPTSVSGTFTVSVMNNTTLIQSNEYSIDDSHYTNCSFDITDWININDGDTLSITLVKK